MAEREAVALATVDASTGGRARAWCCCATSTTTPSAGSPTTTRARAASSRRTRAPRCSGTARPLGRQMRVEGDVARAEPAASDAYFATRARGEPARRARQRPEPRRSRAARSSTRSWRAAARRFDGVDGPAPANWGGYRADPDLLRVLAAPRGPAPRPRRLRARRRAVDAASGWRPRVATSSASAWRRRVAARRPSGPRTMATSVAATPATWKTVRGVTTVKTTSAQRGRGDLARA